MKSRFSWLLYPVIWIPMIIVCILLPVPAVFISLAAVTIAYFCLNGKLTGILPDGWRSSGHVSPAVDEIAVSDALLDMSDLAVSCFCLPFLQEQTLTIRPGTPAFLLANAISLCPPENSSMAAALAPFIRDGKQRAVLSRTCKDGLLTVTAADGKTELQVLCGPPSEIERCCTCIYEKDIRSISANERSWIDALPEETLSWAMAAGGQPMTYLGSVTFSHQCTPETLEALSMLSDAFTLLREPAENTLLLTDKPVSGQNCLLHDGHLTAESAGSLIRWHQEYRSAAIVPFLSVLPAVLLTVAAGITGMPSVSGLSALCLLAPFVRPQQLMRTANAPIRRILGCAVSAILSLLLTESVILLGLPVSSLLGWTAFAWTEFLLTPHPGSFLPWMILGAISAWGLQEPMTALMGILIGLIAGIIGRCIDH